MQRWRTARRRATFERRRNLNGGVRLPSSDVHKDGHRVRPGHPLRADSARGETDTFQATTRGLHDSRRLAAQPEAKIKERGRGASRGQATAGDPAPEPDMPPPEGAPPKRRFGRRRTGPVPSGPEVKNSCAVVNQKGGVGKTTVCLVLVVAAARRGGRVLLVDLDPQASATAVLRADDEDRLTVADVMLDPSATRSAIPLPRRGGGSTWPPRSRRCGRRTRRPRRPTRPCCRGTLRRWPTMTSCYSTARRAWERPRSTRLPQPSRALIVTEPTFLRFKRGRRPLDALWHVTAEYNPSLEIAGIVLNRVEASAEHRARRGRARGRLGSQVGEPHIPKRAVLQDATR